jgi:Flp pilus assembly protein protease CpaA
MLHLSFISYHSFYPISMILQFAILATAGISACFDLATARIPNWVFLSSLAAGVCIRFRQAAEYPFFEGAAGMAVPVLILALFWHHRMIGGGDVKLLAVIGFYTGPGDILWIIFWSFAAAAVISVGILWANRSWQERLGYFLDYVQGDPCGGSARPYRRSCHGRSLRSGSEMHFAVAVLMEVMMYVTGARP